MVISACTKGEQDENTQPSNRNPYLNLSTEVQDEGNNEQQLPIKENQTEDSPLLTEESPLENSGQVDTQVPNDHNSLQQTIPEAKALEEEHVPNETEQEQITTPSSQEQEDTTISTELPFQNFKERWNAITEEQFSELYIEKLAKVSDKEGTYEARLTNKINLNVYVNDKYIQKLEIISFIDNKNDVFQMLSGWQQVINILHPTIEIHDVDTFFSQIGIGPDADLSNVEAVSFTYYELYYEVSPIENGYLFSAKFNNL